MYYINVKEPNHVKPYGNNVKESNIIIFKEKPNPETLQSALQKLGWELRKFVNDGIDWFSGVVIDGECVVYSKPENYIVINGIESFNILFLKHNLTLDQVNYNIKAKSHLYTMYNR